MYEMYRLMAIAKYDDRYVIPKAHVEQAHELEEIGCSLDFDEGPGMYDSGPFGEASGRPVPVAVETFHALKQRQTSDDAPPATRSCAAGSTCSTGTATARPTGLFPPTATDAAVSEPMRPLGTRRHARGRPPGRVVVPRLPRRRARSTGCRCSRAAARRAGRRRRGALDPAPRRTSRATPLRRPRSATTSRSSTCRASTRSTCPTGPTATPGGAARCWPVQGGATGPAASSSTPRGELPDYLPMVLEFAAVADPDGGRGAAAGVPAEPRAAAVRAARGRARRTPTWSPPSARRCPGLARRPGRGAWRWLDGPPTETVGLEPYDPRLLPLHRSAAREPRWTSCSGESCPTWCSRCSSAARSGATATTSSAGRRARRSSTSRGCCGSARRCSTSGILVVFIGHVGGLVIPESWTEAVGISEEHVPLQRAALRRHRGLLHAGRHRDPDLPAAHDRAGLHGHHHATTR